MLLEHQLLIPGATVERRAAEVWRIRERTEHEAASLFGGLARDLAASDAPEHLVALAARCADDERIHATHCRAIIDALAPGLAPMTPVTALTLGPSDHDPGRRALYTSVALGCVTESLSTALLIELRPHATVGVVRGALDVILEDEIRHSRLGWAHLAFVAGREDVRWLRAFVPAMLRAALDSESPAIAGEAAIEDRPRLRACGILDRDEVRRICRATIETTIVPGLARYGIELGAPV